MLKTLVLTGLGAGIAVAAAAPASAHTAVGHTTVSYRVQAYEDGSGRITREVRHVGRGVVLRTVVEVGEGILPWECDRNGNRVCGVHGDPSTRTVTLVNARRPGMPHSVALTWSTTGRPSVRIATDEDAEGEVV
jgi:hypothetical protein